MKYANKLAIPYVLIIGETEKNKSLVTIKDMVSGEQNLTTIEEAIKIIIKE